MDGWQLLNLVVRTLEMLASLDVKIAIALLPSYTFFVAGCYTLFFRCCHKMDDVDNNAFPRAWTPSSGFS